MGLISRVSSRTYRQFNLAMASSNEPTSVRDIVKIPEAEWIDDVGQYLEDHGIENAKVLFARLDEQYRKFKFYEQNLLYQKTSVNNKLPDILACQEIVKTLQKRRDAQEDTEQY